MFLPLTAATLSGILAAAFLGAFGADPHGPAQGPSAAQSRPHPDLLAACEGAFDLAFAPDGARKGTSRCQLGIGGLWLLEQVQAEFGGKAYEGRGTTSYDPARNRYVSVWIDSMSPRPLVTEGTYNQATKTLTLAGDMATPDGTVARAVLVTVFRDAGARTFAFKVVRPDGRETELFRIEYQRRTR